MLTEEVDLWGWRGVRLSAGRISAAIAPEADLWGWRGVRLSAGRISAAIAPEAGGRLISLTIDGEEALFTLPELRGVRSDAASGDDVRALKRHLGWRHFGGHKTWLAPQDAWTDALPFLDLDSGAYAVSTEATDRQHSVRVVSPVCRETSMRLERTVRLSSDGTIEIEESMTNEGDAPAAWGLWGITQVLGPGVALLPVAEASSFPGGVKAYATEGRSVEVRDRFVSVRDGTAYVTCGQVEPFKYGTDSAEGWIAGVLDRGDKRLALVKAFDASSGEEYPHQAIVEVFDSGELPYFEIEVHSPRLMLAPGEWYRRREAWTVESFPNSTPLDQIREWIAKSAAAMKRASAANRSGL